MKRILRLSILACMIGFGFAAASAQTPAKFFPPFLITSAGQSADVTMAGMLCKKAAIEARTVTQARAGDLQGVKTLVMVPGFSSKGLGAAGTSREQELDRVKDLLAAAKTKGIPVLLLHLGGKARRGVQSDDFNRIAAESSRKMIVVKQGDEDKFFTTIAGEKKIALELVDKIAGVITPLTNLVK